MALAWGKAGAITFSRSKTPALLESRSNRVLGVFLRRQDIQHDPTQRRTMQAGGSNVAYGSSLSHLTQGAKMITSSMKTVFCPICHLDIQVRSGFAYQTLTNHLKTHKKNTEEGIGDE